MAINTPTPGPLSGLVRGASLATWEAARWDVPIVTEDGSRLTYMEAECVSAIFHSEGAPTLSFRWGALTFDVTGDGTEGDYVVNNVTGDLIGTLSAPIMGGVK